MKSNAYTIFDSKSKTYTLPWFAMNDEVAIRAFKDKVNKEGHEFNLHPEDYSLFGIGSYEDNTGVLTPSQTHDTLGKALEYLDSKNGK